MQISNRTNYLAIAAMVFAILPVAGMALQAALIATLELGRLTALWSTIVRAGIYLLGALMLLSSLMAILLGALALRDLLTGSSPEKGKGLAWSGIAIGAACIVLTAGLYFIPPGIIRALPVAPPSFTTNLLGAPDSPMPVSEGQRFSFALFSIGAPAGSGWTYRQLEGGISFETVGHVNGADTPHSQLITVALATAMRLGPNTNYSKTDFFTYACNAMLPPRDEKRFTEQHHECRASAEFSFDCVRFEGLYQDHGTVDNPISPPLSMAAYDLVCRHPDFYNLAVVLSYFQRGPEGSLQDDLAGKADNYFKSVGMNYPASTATQRLSYESGGQLRPAEAGTNLALGKTVRVSRQLPDFRAARAVDGSTTDWWGAGARPPQWIEIDLGGNYPIDTIQLWISQSPAGRTIHQVLARGVATNDEFRLIHTFDEVTYDSERLSFTLPEALDGVRYIRIETTYSPSWVSWREIAVLAAK